MSTDVITGFSVDVRAPVAPETRLLVLVTRGDDQVGELRLEPDQAKLMRTVSDLLAPSCVWTGVEVKGWPLDPTMRRLSKAILRIAGVKL
jgi:hypothetical protein